MGKSDFDRSLEAFAGLIAAVREVAASLRGGMGGGVEGKLDTIIARLDRLINKENEMSAELDALKVAVAKNTSVIESALLLIQGFKAALDAALEELKNSGNPAALKALSAELGAEDDKLAAAVAAGTGGGGGGGGTPIALAAGQVGVPYSATLDPIPGLAPFSNTVTGGTLPAGLTADITAPLISGTPTAQGDSAFEWTSTDADPLTSNVVRNYTISIAAGTGGGGGATTLAPGTVGQSYSAALTAPATGTAPYTYALSSGAVPDGTAISSDGFVGGIPMTTGTFNFGAAATDSTGLATPETLYTIVVS